ncbi:MAG: DegQ family serine endoprotease [Gammaproteobacteria bacterium]|jgi:Do/DeqQ family serine protease
MTIKDLSIRYLLVFGIFISQFTHAALPDYLADGNAMPSLAPMLDDVTPAVVNIATEGRITVQQNPLFSDPFYRRFFNLPGPVERKTQSLGSGVIVDASRGLVLTNNHVIENAVQITVTLRDGRSFEAELIGTDPETDIAVIKIPPENLTGIKPANSDALRVGDYVVAIGNPFGLGQTVTSGIVSALGRSGLGIEGYEDFIQTDASINPGNSGGALVNLRGELIGINTAIFSQSGGNIGIGFAIPINLSLHIMEQLVSSGQVDRGFIGISVQDLTNELADALGVNNKSGAIIASVNRGSLAEQAGLQPGDVLVAIDGKDVSQANDVRNHIGLLPVGKKVVFEFYREAKRQRLTVQVSSATKFVTSQSIGNQRLDGIRFNEIESDSRYYGVINGVVVTEIDQASLAWQRGLRQGDIITSVNREPLSNIRGLFSLVEKYSQSLLLRIVRGNTAAFLVLR